MKTNPLPNGRFYLKGFGIETTEILEAAEVQLDGITAALTYVEDQLEDLRCLITDRENNA